MSARPTLAISRLRPADLSAILPIERASYPAPWSVAMFILELTRREGMSLAARIDEELAGYVICTPQADEWHVMNVTVAPEHRRSGIARALLTELHATIGRATASDPRTTLEVRPSNAGARRLYGQLGYLVAGRRTGYYGDDQEDALVMWRTAATLRGELTDIPVPDLGEAARWNPDLIALRAAHGGEEPR